MLLDISIAMVLWIGGFILFGRFIAPRGKVAGKFMVTVKYSVIILSCDSATLEMAE